MKKNDIGVFNPLLKDFSVKYDIDGTYSPKTFIAKGRDITYFDPVVARHVKKHLVDAILNRRGVQDNYELDKKRILEEISV